MGYLLKSAESSEILAGLRAVFAMIVAGSTNRQVGENLGISNRTVEAYRKNIMGKLGVKNPAQLVQYAHHANHSESIALHI